MKKVALLLALIILVSVPLTAQAATPRFISIRPSLSYNGSVATCSAQIVGNSTSEYLEATIKLWHQNSCIKTWKETGYGYIFFSESATIVPGYTYTLMVDLSVNGVAQDTVSITR